MRRGRVRRWATRVVLAAVFGAAALGAWQSGQGRLVGDVIWGQRDVIWGVTDSSPEPPGP
jgi:hypothetical protein